MDSAPVQFPALHDWAVGVLKRLGAPEDTADIVSQSLVDSDLRGYDTQGVRRLIDYAASVRSGVLDPVARPEERPSLGKALTAIDGHDGFGQLTAHRAVLRAGEIARDHGISAVALRRCHHVGRLGGWVEKLAEQGLIAQALSQGDKWVAPPGSGEPMFGSNPIAWALPSLTGPPVVVDFATAATSVGRVAAAADAGVELPLGVVVDGNGVPSRNPQTLFAGGALLPFGEHKGYGLSVITDLIGATVGGTRPASHPQYSGHHGVVLIAIDPSAWGLSERITEDVDWLRGRLAGVTSSGSAPLRLPGDRAAEELIRRRANGIPIHLSQLSRLDDLARSLQVAPLSDSMDGDTAAHTSQRECGEPIAHHSRPQVGNGRSA